MSFIGGEALFDWKHCPSIPFYICMRKYLAGYSMSSVCIYIYTHHRRESVEYYWPWRSYVEPKRRRGLLEQDRATQTIAGQRGNNPHLPPTPYTPRRRHVCASRLAIHKDGGTEHIHTHVHRCSPVQVSRMYCIAVEWRWRRRRLYMYTLEYKRGDGRAATYYVCVYV